MRVSREHLDKLDIEHTRSVVADVVASHETGLLFVDGEFVEELPPGRHAFWAVGRRVEVAKVDRRPTPLEVTAQEILTKDRVGIRVTLTAFYRIVDAVKATTATSDVAGTLYRLVQFAIREAVATRTLDDILAARDAIDHEVRGYVSARAGDLGVEVVEIGVKDVILPGEIRELIKQVGQEKTVILSTHILSEVQASCDRVLIINRGRLVLDSKMGSLLEEEGVEFRENGTLDLETYRWWPEKE